MHYQDELGEWQALDTAIVDLGDGSLGARGAPVRLTNQGLVRILNLLGEDIYSQITTRVAVYNSSTNNIVTTFDLPVGTIDDDKLIKETDLYRHIITLKETGVREELIIKQKPDGITDNDNLWLVLDTVVTGVSFDDGWIDGIYEKEEYKFPLPIAHDADGREGNPMRYAKTIDGVQHILTGLKFSKLYQASYPVTIDPDFAGSTSDGWIRGTSSSPSTARSTSSYETQTGDTMAVGRSYALGSYNVFRCFLVYDTSSIASDANITQVNLRLTFAQDDSDVDFDIQVVKYDWSAYTSWSTYRETLYDGCLNADADNNIFRNTSPTMWVSTQYASGNLDTSWINKDGSTYYGLRSSRDKDNDTHGEDYERVHFYQANFSTESWRPVLTVTYSTGDSLTSQDVTAGVPSVDQSAIPSPSKVILVAPTNTGSVSSAYPELSFYATDPQGNSLEYQVEIDTSSQFNTVDLVQVSSESDAGFENVDTPADTHPFNSGDEIKYTVQEALSQEAYYWRVRAKAGT
jgi:hypothetical protein